MERGAYWEGLQGSFKVLINSFYGYLGGPFNFNDYEAAKRVTELGRELVKDVAERMEAVGQHGHRDRYGWRVFRAAARRAGRRAGDARIWPRSAARCRRAFGLAFDGRFATMLSLKTKNYVLVTYEGRRIFKGASLRSRADERYGRHFLAQAVDCLLEHDFDGVAELYARRSTTC